MAKIKIISNPYAKEITYQKWQEGAQVWSTIDYNSNPNSRLLRESCTHGFFTLIAANTVDTIIEEYRDDQGPIELVFEGTSDEYNELSQICESESYAQEVLLRRSESYLENARDILPVINRVFKDSISPLVSVSVRNRSRIEKDLNRFAEAANDIVPVCVMGNYSTGKSSFINALIGSEILPTGDVPVTAKIYRIERSMYDDRAYIRFDYFDEPAELRFDERSWRLTPSHAGSLFAEQLSAALDAPELRTITDRIRRALEIINSFEDATPDVQEISDLISLEVPFGAASCGFTGGDFVVFDTPGSNSASNVNHAEVLQSAMQNMTNGLPIFVTEYDKLDSTDNEALYHRLLSMDELDSAFTAIVVNKADASSLPKKGFTPADREQLLNLAVPRQLYSDGIFFVSSVMGLGAKTDGEFFDDHCAEIFEDQERKYSDPDSRFYKQLYKYNVQPAPLNAYANADAEACKDLLFANSGLYSVEREIRNFALRFSPYNKSTQACRFLDKVIAVTEEELEQQRQEGEESRKQLEEKLATDKLALIKQVEEVSNEQEQTFVAGYPTLMQAPVGQAMQAYDEDVFRMWQAELVLEQQSEQALDAHREELKQSRDALGSNLKENLRMAVRSRKLADLKNLGSTLMDDAKNTLNQTSTLLDTQREIDRVAADKLLDRAKNDFNDRAASAQTELDAESRRCWENYCQELKNALLAVIAGAEVLTEQRRAELSEIIITYTSITFDAGTDSLFVMDNFKRRFTLKNILVGNNDVLNIEYLQKSYNEALASAVDEIRSSIAKSHEDSFKNWLEALVGTITRNIVSYSPELSRLSDEIEAAKREVRNLENRMTRLAEYKAQITDMMAWKQ